jgi:hypothetical protein
MRGSSSGNSKSVNEPLLAGWAPAANGREPHGDVRQLRDLGEVSELGPHHVGAGVGLQQAGHYLALIHRTRDGRA